MIFSFCNDFAQADRNGIKSFPLRDDHTAALAVRVLGFVTVRKMNGATGRCAAGQNDSNLR
jgi:hypothetical protein